MGKFTQGVLGKTRGKIDGVVIQRFRVGYIDREKVIPRNPRTAAQVSQRYRFAAMSSLTRMMRPITDMGFSAKVRGTMMSPANGFAKANFPIITASGSGVVSIAYPQMLVSDGAITDLFVTTAPVFDNPAEVSIPWSSTGAERPQAGVLGHVVIVCPDMGAMVTEAFDLTSSTSGVVNVSVPGTWGGLRAHVYAFASYSGDSQYGFAKGDVSRSMYVGAGNIG